MDEETKAAVKDSLFTILKFGKLIEWCDENTVPVPEDAIQLVKSDAQVLKEADIFEFDFENDTAFVENNLFFKSLLERGVTEDHIIRLAFDSADDLRLIGENLLALQEQKRNVDPEKFMDFIRAKLICLTC